MSRSLDRLTLLATFARIAERGSISAAARDLNLSQASASRQLSELERRLAVPLIHRTTHSLSLTKAGEDCLVEARGLLEGWDALAERYAESGSALRGKLKIVAPVALGQLQLADAVLSFQQAYPDLAIAWLLQDGAIRFAEIGCDLWIKVGRVPDESLVVRPLGRVERMVVASPKLIRDRDLLVPEDLGDLPCAALEPFEAGRIPLSNRRGDAKTIAARVVLTTNNIFAAQKAARMGIGYAVMPRWLVETDLKIGALVEVLPDWRAPSLAINAAYLPARRQTRRLQLFLEHVTETVAAMSGIEMP
ncbi:MAG: LysR family transcriptional regulator [Kiloniellales bacterium]